jgi:hypothetical protein
MNSISYTGDGTTTSWNIPFPYISPSDLTVYVGGVSVAFSASTYGVADITVAPASGATITISRHTDITTPVVDFSDSGAILESDIDKAFAQVRYSVEEAHTRIDSATLGVSTGGSSNVPTPSAVSQFAVSISGSGGPQWSAMNLAAVQTLLGVTTPVSVPSPLSGGYFLTTNSSTAAYQLRTTADTKTLLGLPVPFTSSSMKAIHDYQGAGFVLITSPNNQQNEWAPASSIFSWLGLGNAATRVVGTAVGQLVEVVSSGSGPALPALWGGNLTGIAQTIQTVRFSRTQAAATSPASNILGTTWSNHSYGGALSATPAWVTLSGGEVQLQPGTYFLKATATCYANAAGTASLDFRIRNTSGTVTGLPAQNTSEQVPVTAPLCVSDPLYIRQPVKTSIECWITVTAAAVVVLEVKKPSGTDPGTTVYADYSGASITGYGLASLLKDTKGSISCVLDIWKTA